MRHILLFIALLSSSIAWGCPEKQTAKMVEARLLDDSSVTFKNPILPGYHPDPSICRVNDDYYMAVSSFVWYPGVPIYHSKDLVNWELIGHVIDRPDMIKMHNLGDNDGIYAPTLRYHNGTFYMITTAVKSGENFYVTATDPRGPWSDPIWLEGAPGIDPSLFWDDDGKCYYTGNAWNIAQEWKSQCGIWMQELDLEQGKLVGERKILTYGHANNAAYTEAPHLYKINGKYVLIVAEGGTEYNHSVTVHHSNSLWGPYVASKTNPIMTHRHLGKDYPIQATGHTDLIQTQHGDWYAVLLAKRMVDGYSPLARETFLCKVDFQNGTPIFNPGYGRILEEQERPNLPWTPVREKPARDEFDIEELGSRWYFTRVPQQTFYALNKGQLALSLLPERVDELVSSAMIIQKTKHHHFTATTKMSFQTRKENEEAGLILYRTANGYFSLMKDKSGITLTRKDLGKKEVVARMPYDKREVYLAVSAEGLEVRFYFGETPDNMVNIGGVQSMAVVSDNDEYNLFNGVGVGVYGTSNGEKTKAIATYDWFEYKERSE